MKKILTLFIIIFAVITVNAQTKKPVVIKTKPTVETRAVYAESANSAVGVINAYIKNGWTLQQTIVCPVNATNATIVGRANTDNVEYVHYTKSEILLIFTYQSKK